MAIFFLQGFNLNVGIALGRGKRTMSEQFLNGAEVGSFGQEVRGKGVAQGVWGERIGKFQVAADFF